MKSAGEAIDLLKSREATTSCDELVGLLRALGFDVRRRKSGNHHTLDHPGIPGFTGANFDGGHGKTVKTCYLQEMRKLIKKYEAEINEHLKAKK
ncbi:type II toxin-antitoxin system HicA family toxin [Roseateles sp.]|jgi:hypothetical protein|uniref:type II toxin-antitoxin system HicA family toxin n=1 Tax=Roseateles sp. TaxID=1971397 RepID=UPI003BA540F9